MTTPTKVTLEVTAESFTWRVFAGEEQIAERTMKRVNDRGGYRSTQKASVFEESIGDDELHEAITNSNTYDIADALGGFAW